MTGARDTGTQAASGKVRLVQEIDDRNVQAGFLIYVPVYKGGGIPPTAAQRREKLIGFVYAPFRGDDLFRGIFQHEEESNLDLEVYDGAGPGDQTLLHRSRAAAQLDPRPQFSRTA